MKKLLLTTAIILGSLTTFMPQKAQSLTVSDPGMYARAAKELQVLKEQVGVLKGQLEEAKKTYEAVSGNLKRGAGIAKELGDLKTIAEKMTKATHSFPNMDTEDFDMKNAEDVREILDTIYKKEDGVLNGTQTEKQKRDYHQRSVKGALENSETIMASQEEKFEKIQRLANEIDSTQSLKDAMDLSNRLTAELLLVAQQSLMLQAQTTRANELLRYAGIDSEAQEGNPNRRSGDRIGDMFEGAGAKSKENYKKAQEKQQWEKPKYF